MMHAPIKQQQRGRRRRRKHQQHQQRHLYLPVPVGWQSDNDWNHRRDMIEHM